MDRRRFVPSSEGLEVRSMLSTASPAQAAAATAATTAAIETVSPTSGLPNSPEQKALRIARLPAFLRGIQENRYLPDEAVASLQEDLNLISGQLLPPPQSFLDNFNLTLRDVIPNKSLSAQDAEKLNQSFGRVLHAAGATPQAEARLKADMNALAKLDSNDINPVVLATNDYAIILETALGVGRPIRSPSAPVLATLDVVGSQGSRVTTNNQPRFIGSYDAGVTIQLLDTSGNILGSGVTQENGRYNIQISTPLAPGSYSVAAQAIADGSVSLPSRAFSFRVISPPQRFTIGAAYPAGPRGL